MSRKQGNGSRNYSQLRSELLKFNGRIQLSRQDLAALIPVSTTALRNWEAGLSKPTAQNLKKLIEIYLQYDAFTKGEELAEAKSLWEAAREQGEKAPFDEKWFQVLMTKRLQPVTEDEPEQKPEQEFPQNSQQEQQKEHESEAEIEQVKENASSDKEHNSSPQPVTSSTLPSSRVISRRTVLVSLGGLIAGGMIGSVGTWAAMSSRISSQPQAKWVQTANMIQDRDSFRATLLGNGLVLVEGGYRSDGTYTRYSELFDQTTGTWNQTKAVLNEARAQHTATMLPGGKVLVAGGYGNITLNSAEIYDPTADTWTFTQQTMNQERTRHTATLLKSGKVLVAGGVHHNSAELYDPATDIWSLTAAMATRRSDHIAVRLQDDSVLVAGGTIENDGRSVTNTAEIYDPITNTWSATQKMNIARGYFTAIVLPDGKVMIIGGRLGDGSSTATTEIYDPSTQSWSLDASMRYARQNPLGLEAILLEDGKVLVVGGDSKGTSEMYSPTAGAWMASLLLSFPHGTGATAFLNNGQVLVAGGFSESFTEDQSYITASTEIYRPAST